MIEDTILKSDFLIQRFYARLDEATEWFGPYLKCHSAFAKMLCRVCSLPRDFHWWAIFFIIILVIPTTFGGGERPKVDIVQ